MAEIIFQRRKAATIFMEPSPVLIIILVFLQMCSSQVINRAPHFVPQTGDMSTFSLAEDTPVGTPVYQLKGIDPDNGPLRYSISGQYFTVDPVTGVVTLARKLDREEMESLELVISITDEGIANTEPNTISLRRVIPVKDINDNPPVFHNRPYIVNISEATAITPNKYQVRIFLATALDFESRTAYIISLEAHDSSARPLRSLASVSAAVRDVQDQPPLFLNAPYSATVAENTPQDVSIMEIMAKDGDTANQRPVLLTLEGDVLNYFRLLPDRPMGRATLVTTDVPIDRESDVVIQNGGVYSFSVKATELINNEVPSDFTVIPITIIVTDVDDHIPKFNKDTFDISIPENIENGSPIPGLSIYVEDIDLGENSRYNLHLRDVYNSEGVFSLTTTRGEGRVPISVKVKDSSKLDYDVDDDDKRMFSFDIVTSVNGEELSYARVNVKLLDVNDNGPIFKEQNYKFNVLENSPIETKLGEVQATDKDYGIFGELEYSLSGFGSNFFKTDINKGGIYVARELDYESQKSYSLTLFAKDGGGKISSTSIFIEVLDENDNMPMFEALEYTRTIREGATSFEPLLVVRATDIDGPSQGGGRVRYTIESDNSIEHRGRVFSIDEDNGEITIDNKVESMDTPRGQYELVVRATDYGVPPLYNETRVLIRVGVPGNQRPTFKGNYHHYKYTVNQKVPDNNEDYTFDINPMNYKATIREDARPGQNVTAVVANDPDGLDDLLTYHIVSGSKDNFIINEKTGLITVSNDANLDRDTNTDRYEIIVSAVDSGLPQPETATTTVFVNILDVNDKPPQFNTSDSTTYISERKPIGETVTVLTAFDTDSTAKLKYTIIEPIKAFSRAGVQLKPNAPYDYKTIFRINEDNGEISVSGKLDYSQVSVVILTVKVVDINAELNKEEQFAITEYTIYIQPYTDNNPQFINPGWTITNPIIYHKIKEEQPIGSTVLVLMAEDPTSGHMVSNFKVVNSETGLLQVDPLSGQVVLTRHLDYEELKTPNLTLTVHAVSNDGSKHSSAKIIIEVMNINDNPPIFDKELYKVSVLESIQYPEQVGVVKAEDKDAVLSAEDKEKGYADVRYVLRGDNRELFVIDNVTGVIKVAPNKTLDRERQSVLRVEVEAYDTPRGGVDRLKSVAVVLIDVLDVDDNAPTFDKSVYTAVIPENVAVGTSVVKLLATDPDEGLGGEIKYEFLDEGEANVTTIHNSTSYNIGGTNSPVGSVVFQVVASDPDDPSQPSGQLSLSLQQTDVFAIDPDTGVITTRQALDRERTAAYTLVLSVTDRGQPPQQTTRIVTVDVTDVDDHKPHFARNLDDPPVLLTTYEEVPIGSIIGTLAAVDEDIRENAAIDYIITGLDREVVARILLTVKCFKLGSVPRINRYYNRLDPSEIQITIKILDIDDHLPEFETSNMTIGVRLNAPIDTVIATIKAIDKDPEALAIDYSLVNMSFESPIKSRSINNITDFCLCVIRLITFMIL
ncbi:unnamed protein product, partial [Leptidea sinapis]